MGRARLRLGLLPKEKARRKTYETRKKGLEKKAKELSTLCGVDLCMVMYPPPLKNEEVEPFVWSNNPDQVANLIESHKLSRLGGVCSRSRTCDLAWFYKDQTRKVEEEIEKLRKKNGEAKYPNWDERYDSLSLEELRMFVGVLTAKVESTKETLWKERKVEIPESSFSMNPRIDENPDSSLGTRTYFDAQSYLENQQRMMMIDNRASFSGSHINYQINNVTNYDVQNVANSVPGYGQHQLIDYFPQMFYGFHPNMGF